MGFLDTLLGMNHRSAIPAIQKKVLELELSAEEISIARQLELDVSQVIAERHLFMAAVVRGFLGVFAQRTQATQVILTHQNFGRAMDDYFSSRPGINAAEGHKIYIDACSRYSLPDLDLFPGRFLEAVTGNRRLADEAPLVIGLEHLINGYTKTVGHFIGDKVTRLVRGS